MEDSYEALVDLAELINNLPEQNELFNSIGMFDDEGEFIHY